MIHDYLHFYLSISQKKRNFALVIEIKRHLEILLLDNDCVVVPGFGGFVAYHVSAHFDESDGVFVPPMRTIGFNPNLKMNDSLLAQSYVEAYDISYPEALQRIESEVAELRQTIASQGSFTLDGIGTLEVGDETSYLFTPCEAGILTPELYGLNTFSMTVVVPQVQEQVVKHAPKPKRAMQEATAPIAKEAIEAEEKIGHTAPSLSEVMADDDDEERAISIKLSWIRNVAAVAAAVVMFFMMSTPVANSNFGSQAMIALQNENVYQMAAQQEMIKPVARPLPSHQAVQPTNNQESSATQTNEVASKDAQPLAEKVNTKAEKDSKKHDVLAERKAESRPFCLVLASRVKRSNAEEFVKSLKARGIKDVEIYEHNNVIRVTYGHFRSEQEAYDERNNLRFEDDFADAWVYKKKSEI